MASTTKIAAALETPPQGQTSNFDHPASQRDAIIAICIVYLILTLFCVGIRVYFSARVAHTLGAEDCEWPIQTHERKMAYLGLDVCIAATVSRFVRKRGLSMLIGSHGSRFFPLPTWE